MSKADNDTIREIIKNIIHKSRMDKKDNPFVGLSLTQLEEIAKSWQAAKKILQENNNPPKNEEVNKK